ncbi:IS1634 family transposase [Psittacicella hinzii]|uniref:Transposase n=1 Tax=Psittacicella hinzii TaxID=2028575 RepID=A0A3A1YR35_9GAMM|nr:hypothetical protein [Psittacicella hinzii]RIY40632.1 hypothetical protein CKF58_00205 [Psittacicella hinzii]
MLKLTSAFNERRTKFVINQDNYSEGNLKTFDDHNHSFISFIPSATSLGKSSIDQAIEIKLGYEHCLPGIPEVKAMVKEAVINGVKCKVHTYFDEMQRVEALLSFDSEIKFYEAEIKSRITAKQQVKSNKYFTVHCLSGDKQQYTYERNLEAIKKEYAKLGYFCLVTNELDLTSLEVLNLYHSKEMVDKSFKDVSHILQRRIKPEDIDTANGRMFVFFISLILLSMLQNKIAQSGSKIKVAIEEIIAELDDIKYFVTHNEKILHPLTTLQKSLIEALGLNLDLSLDLNLDFV